MASAIYDVKFSCKLCRPLKNSIIVCEVIAINKVLTYLRNGPIQVMIFEASGNINEDRFVFDEKKNLLMAYVDKNKEKGIPVIKGTFVKVKVVDVRMENKVNRIIVIGTLESIASKTETEQSIKNREKDDIDFIDYEDYTKNEHIDLDEINKKDIGEKQTKQMKEEIVKSESDNESNNESNNESDSDNDDESEEEDK